MPTDWNKRVRDFASVSGGLLMQVKYRARKLPMRYAVKNQTNTNLICKLLHSFIENSEIIFFFAGALFFRNGNIIIQMFTIKLALFL